jgi:hypothetical protein
VWQKLTEDYPAIGKMRKGFFSPSFDSFPSARKTDGISACGVHGVTADRARQSHPRPSSEVRTDYPPCTARGLMVVKTYSDKVSAPVCDQGSREPSS